MVESLPIVVVKRDKSREQFDRTKLINSLMRACEKRTVSLETLEKAVDEIESSLQSSLDREVSSLQIGELAMDKLKGCLLYTSDKPSRRQVDVHAAYSGAEVPDEFIVGYGLDYDEVYRNLPFIGVLKPSVYNK